MKTWIPRLLQDDAMIPMCESPSYAKACTQYVALKDHEQALAEKDLELELADFTIKESLEKIAAMDKEIQQIREHEFQRGYQEAEEKYQQRILRIVSTLRPTDPGSWGPNTHYVTMEFNAHDAEQRATIEQQAQEIARLENGLGCSRSHPHEDMNQICELRTEVARLNNELSQRTNLEGSAPCWNSAHMKYIATLREALMGILEIGKRDMTNPKYDGYFEQAKQALEDTKQ